MNNYKSEWLPHLKQAVPEAAKGKGTCMYIMALEGWRRGLELKFIKKKGTGLLKSVAFSLSDGKNEHVFNGSRGDTVTKEAIKICTSKGLTNKYLAEANVPIPGGKAFAKEESNDNIINYANKVGYPLVIKPSDSDGGGAGVITNIKDQKEMESALLKVRVKPISVVVERFFVGEDFRVYVLDGKVIGAFHRRAASVVGDGKLNIKELLDQKNSARQLSPFLAKSSIKIDENMKTYLQKQGMNVFDIPKKGERVFLRRNGEYFKERDSINVTESLSPKMKNIAIEAVNAIPGLTHGGVDMLINLEKDEGVVNEVNSRAQISNHVFPVEGEAVDIPKYLIDYYFPNSINDKATDVPFNFDFKLIVDSFEKGFATEIKVPSIPIGLKTTKRFVLTGSNFDNKFRKWVQRQAIKQNINGYVRTINQDSISIVVAGSEQVINNFKKIIKQNSPKTTVIKGIEVKQFAKPVKVGFELKNNQNFKKQKTKNNNKSKITKKQTKTVKKNRELLLIRLMKKIIRKIK